MRPEGIEDLLSWIAVRLVDVDDAGIGLGERDEDVLAKAAEGLESDGGFVVTTRAFVVVAMGLSLLLGSTSRILVLIPVPSALSDCILVLIEL